MSLSRCRYCGRIVANVSGCKHCPPLDLPLVAAEENEFIISDSPFVAISSSFKKKKQQQINFKQMTQLTRDGDVLAFCKAGQFEADFFISMVCDFTGFDAATLHHIRERDVRTGYFQHRTDSHGSLLVPMDDATDGAIFMTYVPVIDEI